LTQSNSSAHTWFEFKPSLNYSLNSANQLLSIRRKPMKLAVGCHLTFDATEPTPLILMLKPRSGDSQWVFSETYLLEPFIPAREYADIHGNLCQRLIAPVGILNIRTESRVETSDTISVEPGTPMTAIEFLPDWTLQFLLPSRYCQSDRLLDLAEEIVADYLPGYDRVEAIRAWIHDRIEYRYGTSDSSTSALDTAEQRVGVCRDFAHLGIALCRALDIPARMVVGYLYQLEPMDLHAWFEAYLNGKWYTFDPTQSQPRGNRVTIAYGRDAADVAFATQFCPLILTKMEVWVTPIG
jgi:transglutaminase-like putative cysteine protease